MLWLAACTPDPTRSPTLDPSPPADAVALAFVEGPELTPGMEAPLAYTVRATLTRPARLVVEGARTFDLPEALDHEAVLVGWPAGEALDVLVRAIDPSGAEVAVALGVETAALPDGFPPLTVVTPGGAGDVLFAANADGPGTESWIVRVDAAGRVVWWARDPGQVLGLAPLADGGLGYLTDRTTLRVVDGLGREVHAWDADALGLEALYHDVVALPDGAFAAVSFELREVDAYPTSEIDPSAPTAPATVVSTTVVELDEDGVRSTLALADLLDPLRVGRDGVDGRYWDTFLPQVVDPKDWGHGNGLFHDAEADRLLVSLRHQDAVVAIGRSSATVDWILAPEANWRAPWSDLVLRWTEPPPAYHPHGPNLGPDGTLLLFDNGNHGASAFEPPPPGIPASRALEVAIDPVAGTATPIRQYGPDRPDRPFCPSHGGAQALDDGFLVTFGSIVGPARGEPTARIVEVDGDGIVRFELGVGAAPEAGWEVFRAYPLPGGW